MPFQKTKMIQILENTIVLNFAMKIRRFFKWRIGYNPVGKERIFGTHSSKKDAANGLRQ